jgi:hypothetical protein
MYYQIGAMSRPGLWVAYGPLEAVGLGSPNMRGMVMSRGPKTRRFLGVMAGAVEVADFFAPASIARITDAPLAA